jgi:hypothetical protein
MGTVHVRIGEITPGSNPVLTRRPRRAETLTTSTSSTATTITADGGEYATVTVLDAASGVYVVINDNPTASAAGDAIPGGGQQTYGPLKPFDRIAIADVS